jgi:hypothetical protein
MDTIVSFTLNDYWQALLLYSLNNAIYKIALAKALLQATQDEKSKPTCSELSELYLFECRASIVLFRAKAF